MELLSFHPSGAQNFEMAYRFLGNFLRLCFASALVLNMAVQLETFGI